MRLLSVTAVLLTALVSFAGCSVKSGQSGIPSDQYNKLVQKYNSLKDDAYASDLASRNEAEAMMELDQAVKQFLSTRSDSDFKSANTKLKKVEDSLIQQLKAIQDTNSLYKYEHTQTSHAAGLQASYIARGEALDGIRRLLVDAYKPEAPSVARQGPTAQMGPPVVAKIEPPLTAQMGIPNRVELTPQEKITGNLNRGGGVSLDRSGNVHTFNSRSEVMDEARRLQLDSEAVEDNYDMAARTGGLVGLAPSENDLSATMVNVFGHIKANINSNMDDLELGLVLDYSGSMSNKISNVIENLGKIVASLDAVRQSGRNVKIGIVTFGAPGRELVNLPLTANMVAVQAKLKDLLDRYPNEQHSVDPGESSYHGLAKAASGLAWSSKNRKIILVTDEPSYEVRTGDKSYVANAEAALKSQGIQTTIYTILVPRNGM
jgi:hypothetical protein